MTNSIIVSLIFLTVLLFSCNKKQYPTNGETIYRTGRNLRGVIVLDKTLSRIRLFKSCASCHGKRGEAINGVSIKFSYLSSSDFFSVPYTDSLFYRFLDEDIKSDGAKANIGVIWKMDQQDKRDLLNYLKQL